MAEKLDLHILAADRVMAVERILASALDAADPRRAVSRSLVVHENVLYCGDIEINLQEISRIRLVGVGKAARAMSLGAIDSLDKLVKDGLVITKHSSDQQNRLPAKIHELSGGHPIPTPASVSSGHALEEFLQDGQPNDLVICLISGGGSALMTLPVSGVDLEDIQALTRQLLACGAAIGEINTLRKHLDRIKGGGLARMIAPARAISLVLSDVIGSPLEIIASGPTVGDPSTFVQCQEILEKYRLEDSIPARIVKIFSSGRNGELVETLKPDDPRLEKVITRVIAGNYQAATASLNQAQKDGFHTMLLSTYLEGEASQAGIFLAGILNQIHAYGQPLSRPACIVVGGETIVTIKGNGLGGRNQELALSAAFLLDGIPDVALVTLGTDGEDGPTDAAGAVVTGETMSRARSLGLDPLVSLLNNDSYHFFAALGDLVMTGPTGTNVNDLAYLFAF